MEGLRPDPKAALALMLAAAEQHDLIMGLVIQQLAGGARPSDLDLPANYRRRWATLEKRAGTSLRMHDLRALRHR